jgi:hypothetical protein
MNVHEVRDIRWKYVQPIRLYVILVLSRLKLLLQS